MNFVVGEALRQQGVKAAVALFSIDSIPNKKDLLEQEKKAAIKAILDYPESNEITGAYADLHDKHLQPGVPAPAQALISLIKKTGRIPNINCVVDAYNLVSARTFLSIGAHDLDRIKGSLRIDACAGNELYVPLGKSEPQKVNKGEYACMDEEKVICWLDIRQCDQTKVTKDTKRFLVYIQGNSETSAEYIDNALFIVVEHLTKICGATLLETVKA